MGSGKGHVKKFLRKRGVLPQAQSGIVDIDMDEIRKQLPEWSEFNQHPSTAGILTQREAGYIAEIAQRAALDNGQNILVDGSLQGVDWYKKVLQRIRDNYPQYKIVLLYTDAQQSVVKNRIKERAEKEGRDVPQDIWLRSFNAIPNSAKVLEDFADATLVYKNQGGDPQLLYASANSLPILRILAPGLTDSMVNGKSRVKSLPIRGTVAPGNDSKENGTSRVKSLPILGSGSAAEAIKTFRNGVRWSQVRDLTRTVGPASYLSSVIRE